MRKNLILASTLLFSLVTFSQATLVNTKWKPQAESPRIQHLEFKKDTLLVLFTNGRQPEVMSFSHRHDSLLIKKISGEGGACAIGAEGLYRIEWLADGEKLVFSNINDVCPGRVRGFITNPFERVRSENPKN
jgi:hypothetical protein